MSSPYGQHHDSAHSFTAPDPHLPLRRASSQRLQARRQGGPRPLFAATQNHLKGFNPSPVEPVPQIDNVTASSEHAFAGRDERLKRPFKPPLGVQVLQHSQVKNRSPTENYHTRDARHLPPSPLRPDDMTQHQDRAPYQLRSARSVGDGMRWPARRSSKPGTMPSPQLSSRCSSDSVTNPPFAVFGEIRASMRSAATGTSSRVNSSSINTETTSRFTDDSSLSDAEDEPGRWPADLDKRASFDVEDAIGMYEEGFGSARESQDVDGRKLSLDAQPTTANLHPHRPHYLHRRSQSASILTGRASIGGRASRVVSSAFTDMPPVLPDPSSQLPSTLR